MLCSDEYVALKKNYFAIALKQLMKFLFTRFDRILKQTWCYYILIIALKLLKRVKYASSKLTWLA